MREELDETAPEARGRRRGAGMRWAWEGGLSLVAIGVLAVLLWPGMSQRRGRAREAACLVSINFNDQFIHWTDNVDVNAPWPARPRARFPVFWEAKMDYTPDNDHGAVSVNALQSMLLQGDGKRIYLLPA